MTITNLKKEVNTMRIIFGDEVWKH